MLIKTAREVAQHLAHGLPPIGNLAPAPARASTGPQPAVPPPAAPPQAFPPQAFPPPAALGARSGRHAQGPAQEG